MENAASARLVGLASSARSYAAQAVLEKDAATRRPENVWSARSAGTAQPVRSPAALAVLGTGDAM